MLYEVTLRQTYFAQQVINRFHYNSAGTPASVQGSFALTYAMGFVPDGTPPVWDEDALFWAIRDITSNQLVFNEVEVAAMYDPVDFYLRPFGSGVAGLVSTEAASPVLAYGFQSNRVRTDVRRGSKRFAGVLEAYVGAGGQIIPELSGQMNTLAALLSAPLTYDDEGNTLTFSPVVLRFEEYETPRGNRAYKPYATLSAQLAHMAEGITYSPQATVRSQTSRQYGRGR